jgi:hypothetical protein
MIKYFIFGLCFISFGISAQTNMSNKIPGPQMQPMNYKDQKAKILENLNFAISNMTQHRDCITAAADDKALQNCMEKSRKEAEERMKKMNPEGFKKMQEAQGALKPTK